MKRRFYVARREHTQHNQIDKRKHASASAGRKEKPTEAGRRNDHARAERTPVAFMASGVAARDWALPVAVTVETEAQLAEVLKHDAVALVYLDEACFTDFAALIRRVHAAGKKAGLRLRRIERDFDANGRKAENSAELLNGLWKAACLPDVLLVRNLDEAMLLEDFFGAHPELKTRIRRNFDYTVYGYNQEAIQALVSLGADGLTYPIELTYHECRKLREKLQSSVRGAAGTHSTNVDDAAGTRGTNADAVEGESTPVPAAARAGADAEADSIGFGELPFELMIYGHLPMMVSANCIQRTSARCDHGNRILQLRDRMGKDMPVRCYCTYCYNQIFNAEPLVLYDLPDEVRALQPQCLRYDFSVEPAAVVRQVLEGAVPRSMTRGHFRHGIE